MRDRHEDMGERPEGRRGAEQENRDYPDSQRDWGQGGWQREEQGFAEPGRDRDRPRDRERERRAEGRWGAGEWTGGYGQGFGRGGYDQGSQGRDYGGDYAGGAGPGRDYGRPEGYGRRYGREEGWWGRSGEGRRVADSATYAADWWTPGEHTGRGPKGYRRSDDRIREDVSGRLEQSGWIDASEIEVDVSDGIVTLSGTVTSREQKRMAEQAMDSCPGVRDIRNELRVTDRESERGRQPEAAQPGRTESQARSGRLPSGAAAGSQTGAQRPANQGDQAEGIQSGKGTRRPAPEG